MSPTDEENLLRKLREKLGVPEKKDARAELERLFGAREERAEERLKDSLQRRGPQPGDEHVMTVQRLSYRGWGIGEIEHQETFVDGPVPGDTIKLRVTEVRGEQLIGEMVTLVAPSSDRTKPRCDHFGQCSGCHLQCLSYSAQIQAKERVVRDALGAQRKTEQNAVRSLVRSPEIYKYSTHVRLMIRKTGKRCIIGYRRRFDDDILPVTTCPLLVENLDKTLPLLPEALRELPGAGDAKELVLITGHAREDAPLHLLLSCDGNGPDADAVLRSFRKTGVNLIGVIVDNGTRVAAAGDPGVTTEEGGRRGGWSRYPANHHLVRRYREEAIRLASPTPRDAVLELNGGEGFLGMAMSGYADNVYLADTDPFSVDLARMNRGDNQRISVQQRSLHELVMDGLAPGDMDLAILHTAPDEQPPLHDDLRDLKFAKLLYVTSSPVCLARDLTALTANEYRLRVVQPIDTHPHTAGITIMAFLTHRYAGASALAAAFGDL
ncbi:class I SAM-dependent RNA methyltransferase [bacterium]|nr:class I SAM-dependent RNA methyltransferase [candidate division CSSED10-310 bacterium]